MYLMDQNPIEFLIVFTLKFGYMHSQCKYKTKIFNLYGVGLKQRREYFCSEYFCWKGETQLDLDLNAHVLQTNQFSRV